MGGARGRDLIPARGDVIAALHLDETGDRALKLEAAVALDIELLRRRGGRADQIPMRLVERIDDNVEALGGISPLAPELWDAFQHDGVEPATERQIVGGAQRLAAQLVEGEPGDF